MVGNDGHADGMLDGPWSSVKWFSRANLSRIWRAPRGSSSSTWSLPRDSNTPSWRAEKTEELLIGSFKNLLGCSGCLALLLNIVDLCVHNPVRSFYCEFG